MIVGAAIAWAVTGWLLSEASRAQDPAASRIDAIKTGLTIGVGTIGAFGCCWRCAGNGTRKSPRRTQGWTRRITELYTKAVDQLGSANGPVRLGGFNPP